MLDWQNCRQNAVKLILKRYGLSVQASPDQQPIPGSFWGDEEAGLIGGTVFVRADTPLHSLLHESCHAICMGPARLKGLHTDAGGDDAEENAVCYLQILLADEIPGYSAAQCCADMDAWGYSFRLGSAQAWFEQDADDARAWLRTRGLLAGSGQLTPEC